MMAAGINKIDDVYDSDWYREEVAKAERGNREHVAKYERSFLGVLAKADAKSRDLADGDETDRNRNDGGSASVHPAVQIATLLVASGKFPGHAQALHHLLNTSRGQALLQRMSKADQTGKETSMTTSHSEFVQSVVKQYGFVALAKSGVQDGKAYGLDESTCTRLATEYAQGVYPSDRPDVAFRKLYEGEESVRRFFAVVKAMPIVADVTPLVVGGVAATHEAINDTERSEAYQQLVDKAEELRASSPFLSTSQAFARASEQRPDLLARAHRRPASTTSYEWPR